MLGEWLQGCVRDRACEPTSSPYVNCAAGLHRSRACRRPQCSLINLIVSSRYRQVASLSTTSWSFRKGFSRSTGRCSSQR